jgi:hypothetical protein
MYRGQQIFINHRHMRATVKLLKINIATVKGTLNIVILTFLGTIVIQTLILKS